MSYLSREMRLKKKELMEEAWRSRKQDDGLKGKEKLEDGSMDWEELAVESWRTYLGLGDNKELEEMEVDLEEEEDWLDRWLEDDMESGQEEQEEVRGRRYKKMPFKIA